MARDWFDYLDKLAVPVALAIVGLGYSIYKDGADTRRVAEERIANQGRLDLERDTGYVKLLASPNERERDLGLRIIDAMSRRHKFSADLIPVVTAVAEGGRPSNPEVQTATRILNANPVVVPVLAAGAPASRTVAVTTAVDPAPTAVFIQIAREDQRAAARALQDVLRAKGFATPGIELVEHGTINTYVRFFARGKAGVAGEVRDLMNAAGYGAATQNFVNPQKSLPALEVWIGTKSTVTAA